MLGKSASRVVVQVVGVAMRVAEVPCLFLRGLHRRAREILLALPRPLGLREALAAAGRADGLLVG